MRGGKTSHLESICNPRKCGVQKIQCRWRSTQSRFEERAKGNASLVAKAKARDRHRKAKPEHVEVTARVTRADGGVTLQRDCETYGYTEVQTFPQHPPGLSPGQTHLPSLPTQNTYAQPSPSTVSVPPEASTMRAVNHTQTLQAWCLALQVEGNAISSRNEGSVLATVRAGLT